MVNERSDNQTDPVLSSGEQRHTGKLIADMKQGLPQACEELYGLYKSGNETAYHALLLEIRRENKALIQLLIHRIENGDEDAVYLLLDAKQEYVFRVCCQFFKNKEQAEDMTQETLIRVIMGLKKGKYTYQESFEQWLHRVTRNVCINELKKKVAQKRGGGLTIVSMDAMKMGPDNDSPVDIPDDTPSPDTILMYSEQKMRMMELIDRLPQEMRITLILRFYYDLAYEDIARVLDVTAGTIKSRVNRAKAKLMEIIGSMSFEEREALFAENRKKTNDTKGGIRK